MMSIVDAFMPDDKVQVKFTDFYNMMYEAAKAELIEAAVHADVPNRYIRDMLSMRDDDGRKDESSRT